MLINDKASFHVNFEKTKNEDDNENDDEDEDEINKIKINFLNFLNFSALCRLTESFNSKSKLKLAL